MPELPEVETVAADLRAVITGRRITDVIVRERRLRWPLAADFRERVSGKTIKEVERRGKFLCLVLDDATELVVHLGMSGTLRVEKAGDLAMRRHDHVAFFFDGRYRLVYNDPRRFGSLKVRPVNGAPIARLGVDPLGPEFTDAFLWALCRRRKRPIKNLLMDQTLIGGLGNIYANEILFRAGVRPGRAAGRLSLRTCGAIVEATGRVLREAIARRGSSISDFRDASGTPGSYQASFKVYDRHGRPCERCGGPIRRRVLTGRAAFYCSRCQR